MAFGWDDAAMILGPYAIKGISSLFKNDDEDPMERVRRTIGRLRERDIANLRELFRKQLGDVSTMTAQQAAEAGAGAARRALALGDTAATEAYIAPVQQSAYARGSELTKGVLRSEEGAIADANRFYDQAEIQGELTSAFHPQQPGWEDYLIDAGINLYKGIQNDQLLDAIRDAYGGTGRGYTPSKELSEILRTQGSSTPGYTPLTQAPRFSLDEGAGLFGRRRRSWLARPETGISLFSK